MMSRMISTMEKNIWGERDRKVYYFIWGDQGAMQIVCQMGEEQV